MCKLMWQPSQKQIQDANVTAFMASVHERYRSRAADFESLYRWSVTDLEQFWQAVWQFGQVRHSRGWDRVLLDGDNMPGARWFVGAQLNFAENLLRYRDDRTAMIFWGEDRIKRRVSYGQLYLEVAWLARYLRELGIEHGDVVAGFMPNIPEAIVAMLASASIGAIWTSCSPDFGSSGILDRFGQVKPKVLFTADGYYYGGKQFHSLDKVARVLPGLPSVQKVVVVPYISSSPDLTSLSRAVSRHFFNDTPQEQDLTFEQLPFDHPLYIVYSSGTTGVPKCIVHGAGGILLQHLKEHLLHNDLGRTDRIFYFTTCGWMMWNWLVSALATGATLMLYDGSPTYPDAATLFDYAEREKMTVFGTSARYLVGIEKKGVTPQKTHDLSSLKAILSTGSPLLPESFDYVYRNIKQDLRLSSISGGTDLLSCFALGNPTGPVYRGQIQCRGLGMRVDVYDQKGMSAKGEKGELVCTAPFPSMPIGFYNDEDGSKYRKAYFDHFPGVWRHGDWAELTEQGGLIIYGRSDAVLNAGGVRIGTAEIYRSVEKLPEVTESVVVGQDWQGDVRIVLFVRLRENMVLTEDLKGRIRDQIRGENTPRHVPAKIIQVQDIPRTINGKIVELAVKEVIHGREVKNLDALANPEALESYRDLPELRQ